MLNKKTQEALMREAEFANLLTIEKVSEELHIPKECIKAFDNGFSINGRDIKFTTNLWILCDERASFSFSNCHFEHPVNFENVELAKISFFNCVFDEVFFTQYCYFQDLDIAKCTFRKKAIFDSCHFKTHASFYQTNFEAEVSFHRSHFYENISFFKTKFLSPYKKQEIINCGDLQVVCIEHPRNNFRNIIANKRFEIQESIFLDKVDFSDSRFCDVTNFTKTNFEAPRDSEESEVEERFENITFEKKVTFSNVIFSGRISFDKSDFSQETHFKDVYFKENPSFLETNLPEIFQIEQKYLRYKYEDLEKKETPSIWRDFFCRLKSNRLAKHNVIDASELRTQELYAREIELKKEKTKLKDKVEKWQLWFYHNTSDHHTDLLRSFNTLIALIGIFGFLCGSVVLGLDYFVFDYQKGFDILQLKSFFFDNIKNSITSHLLEYFVGNVVLIFVFLGLFLGVMWKYSREILIPLGYIATFGFLATSPKYLIPAMSLFGGKWVALNPLGTIGGIYTLLFGFLAYSFIKTARKNSIIPS